MLSITLPVTEASTPAWGAAEMAGDSRTAVSIRSAGTDAMLGSTECSELVPVAGLPSAGSDLLSAPRRSLTVAYDRSERTGGPTAGAAVTQKRSMEGERDRFFARPAGSERERLRATFDEVAGLYDAARPRYPHALYDDLLELTGVRPGARLLEVGCATGIATRPVLERGYELVCLEPGRRLAAIARRNLRAHRVSVRCTHFETFTGPPDRFELVFAATAWHWVDPEIRYRHAHALLASGGHLAFWNALHAFPTRLRLVL